MKRVEKKVSLPLPKEHFFLWADEDPTALILDSNQYPGQSEAFDFMVAKGVEKVLTLNETSNAFAKLEDFKDKAGDWIFGYFSYDLKNEIESLTSNSKDYLHFPELLFFQPKKILFVKEDAVTFSYIPHCAKEIEKDIVQLKKTIYHREETQPVVLHSRTFEDKYLKNCREIIEKIHKGDIYETNYCIEFYNEKAEINHPLELFIRLNHKTQSPFASFFKHESFRILSTSPERFIKKQGETLISQPVKGTQKRGGSLQKDHQLMADLRNSVKEQAENTMIVDLVRNDFSKIAQKNTVKVSEYCKIYCFKTIHHIVSTVECQIKKGLKTTDIIKAAFPMGSMTGAPKINAMKFIEQFEDQKRGAYSGALGYISPTGDFDFSVMIRTLLYHTQKKYVSLIVGSAITALSSPENEYRECLIKAAAICQTLNGVKNAKDEEISA